jgi:hypothetical protein
VTIRELATHYLRYFSLPGEPAANAPEEIRTFMRTLPEGVDRYSAHNALLSIAGRPQLEHPAAAWWLATHSARIRHCDDVLASRKPPKTYAELVERAYASAQVEIATTVRKFLKDRIDTF